MHFQLNIFKGAIRDMVFLVHVWGLNPESSEVSSREGRNSELEEGEIAVEASYIVKSADK
jgi:hypothetical protein